MIVQSYVLVKFYWQVCINNEIYVMYKQIWLKCSVIVRICLKGFPVLSDLSQGWYQLDLQCQCNVLYILYLSLISNILPKVASFWRDKIVFSSLLAILHFTKYNTKKKDNDLAMILIWSNEAHVSTYYARTVTLFFVLFWWWWVYRWLPRKSDFIELDFIVIDN